MCVPTDALLRVLWFDSSILWKSDQNDSGLVVLLTSGSYWDFLLVAFTTTVTQFPYQILEFRRVNLDFTQVWLPCLGSKSHHSSSALCPPWYSFRFFTLAICNAMRVHACSWMHLQKTQSSTKWELQPNKNQPNPTHFYLPRSINNGE